MRAQPALGMLGRLAQRARAQPPPRVRCLLRVETRSCRGGLTGEAGSEPVSSLEASSTGRTPTPRYPQVLPMSTAGWVAAAEWKRQRMDAVRGRDQAVQRAVALVMSGEVSTIASFNAAMAGCRAIGRHLETLAVWERLLATPGAQPDLVSYQHAMVSAMRLRRYEMAWEIWERLEADSAVTPTVYEYNTAISACERAGMPKRALALVDRLQAVGLTADSNTCHLAVIVCGQLGLPGRADQFLQRLEGVGARPPTQLYNAVLHACAHPAGAEPEDSASANLSLQLIGRMRRLGVPRDGQTYRSALSACARGGQRMQPKLLATLDLLFQEPASCQHGCAADGSLISTALSACAEAGHWRGALGLLKIVSTPEELQERDGARVGKMLGAERSASGERSSDLADLYTLGLQACSRKGRWQEAMGLLSKLENLGLSPSRDGFAYAVAACSNGAQWERVLELCARMEERGMVPRIESQNAAIVANGKLGRCNEALRLFEQLLEHPDANTLRSTASFNAALIACIESRDYPRANALIQQMRDDGVRLNALSFTAAITAAQRMGDIDSALALFTEMQSLNLAPNQHVVGVALAAHLRSAHWKEAMELLSSMGSQDEMPRTSACNEALAACVRDGKWLVAVELFKRMERKGVRPDERTSALAAQAFAASGDWSRGVAMLRQMWHNGWEPSAEAVEAALLSCRDAKQWRVALELLSRALGAGVVGMDWEGLGEKEALEVAVRVVSAAALESHASGGSGKLRALAMEACVEAGEWQHAVRLFDAVREAGCIPAEGEWRVAMVAFAKGGLWRSSLSALPVMHRAGSFAGADELCLAASACAAAGEWERIAQIMTVCASQGMHECTSVLKTAYDACRNSDDVERLANALLSVDLQVKEERGHITCDGVRALSLMELTLSSAMHAHAILGGFDRLKALLERASREKAVLDGKQLSNAMKGCCKAGEWELVLQLISSRVSQRNGGKFHWNMFNYRAALKACRLLGNWQLSVALIRELEQLQRYSNVRQQWTLDSNCYCAAIGAALTRRDSQQAFRAAMELFVEARAAGKANAVLYGSIMQACVLAGWRDRAWSLFEEAMAAGVPLRTHELNIAIGAGARCDKLREAVELLKTMRENGDSECTPDIGSYDAILQPLASAGRYDTLLELIDQMFADGIEPIEPHYALAIGSLKRLGQGGKAASFLLHMKDRGLDYTKAVANAMRACSLEGSPEVALDIFEAARELHWRGNEHLDSTFVFNHALQALHLQCSYDETVALLLQMENPDAESFAVGLQACRRAQKPALLSSVLSALAQRCEREDRFVSHERLHIEMILCLAFFGETSRCVRLFSQLAKHDLPFSKVLVSSVLHSLRDKRGSPSTSSNFQSLRGPIIALAIDRGVLTNPLRWSKDGGALVIDLSEHSRPASIIPLLHFALVQATDRLRHLDRPVHAIDIVTSSGQQDGSLPLDVVTRELTALAITHTVADGFLLEGGSSYFIQIDLSQFRPNLLLHAMDIPPCDGSVALEVLEAAAGPAKDDIDAVIDRMQSSLAPREAWIESLLVKEHNKRRMAAAKRRGDFSLPAGPRRSKCLWPDPMEDGAIPWSTPRRGDNRPRDNLVRARGRKSQSTRLVDQEGVLNET